MLVPAIMTWRSTDLTDNLTLLLLGPLAITAQSFIIRGYRTSEIAIVGPIDYTWLIFAALVGFSFFGEIPTLGVIAGSALIAVGGLTLASQQSSTA